MARVPLVEPAELDVDGEGPAMPVAEMNLTRTVGNHGTVLDAVLAHHGTLAATVPAAYREAAVLAVARETDSEYVWRHHAPAALEAGLSPAAVEAIYVDDHDGLDGPIAEVVRFAGAQAAGTVDGEQVERLLEEFAAADVVALGTIVAAYVGLSGFVDAMAVPLEDAIPDWTPDG